MLSTQVSIDLAELVYLQKMDKSSPSWTFHIIPIIWAFYFIPIIWPFHFNPIMDFSHQCPTAKHKQPNNLIKRKESICKS
jgi:hypothetical protein